jgi:two-component system response regulator FlrC
LRVLRGSAWPGNVRELEKAISRAVIFARGRLIAVGDLRLGGGGITDALVAAAKLGGHAIRGRSLVRETALRIVALRGSVRRRDLVTRLGISGETARQELVALVREGVLRRSGRRRGASYARL